MLSKNGKITIYTEIIQRCGMCMGRTDDIPDEYVDIPYLGSDAYDDYFVIGMYAHGDVLHLSLSKREWVRA